MKLFSVFKTLPPLLLVALLIAGCSGGVVTGLQNYYGHPADVTPPWLNVTPADVRVWGDYAYVAAGANGVHIYDISNPTNPVWVSWVETGDTVADIDADDRYVYAMGEVGFYVISRSTPQSARIIGKIEIAGDLKAMVVEGSYAYIGTWHTGLQIVDISVPEHPTLASSLELNMEDHANCIAVQGDYAVVAVLNYNEHPLFQHIKIIDIKDKEAPVLIGDVAFDQYVQSLEIYNHFVYWGGYYGVHVVDVSSPSSPFTVYDMDSITVYGLAVNGTYLYVSGFEGELPYKNIYFRAFDITNPAQPNMVYSRNVDAICRHMDFAKGYAFVAGGWWGLKVIDINPSSASGIVYSVHTPPREPTNFAVHNGYAYYAIDDLQIFKVSPPESASYIMTLTAPGPLWDIYIQGEYAYAVYNGGMCIIDVDPPESANIVKELASVSGMDITVDGDYAYIMGSGRIVQIVDINPVDSAHLVGAAGSPNTVFHPTDIAVGDGYAYVTYSYFESGSEGLWVFDVDPPESVHFACHAPGNGNTVVAGNGYAFTWADDGLGVIKMKSSQDAQLYHSIKLQKGIAVRALDDGYLYGTHGEGFTIIDVDPVESARAVWDFTLPAWVDALDVDGGYVYLSTDELGLHIISLSGI